MYSLHMTNAQITALEAIKAVGGMFSQTGHITGTRKSIRINGITVYGSTLGSLVDAGILFNGFSIKKDGTFVNTWSIN